MLIDCTNCATSYQVDASSIGAHGRSVRCLRCRNVWFAEPQPEVATPSPLESANEEAVTAFRAELGNEPQPAVEPLTIALRSTFANEFVGVRSYRRSEDQMGHSRCVATLLPEPRQVPRPSNDARLLH